MVLYVIARAQHQAPIQAAIGAVLFETAALAAALVEYVVPDDAVGEPAAIILQESE